MAMVLDAFAGKLVEKLMDFTEEEISMLLGVKGEIKTLRRRLERLSAFLQSAEQKRYTGLHNNRLVMDLRDVMYDADDILDTCMMEGGKLLEVRFDMFNTISSCLRCLKYRHEVGLDIKKLNGRIYEIAKDSQITATISAHIGQSVRGNQRSVSSFTFQTSPIQDDTSIVGSQIEEVAQTIISQIVNNNDDKVKCRIFAITGMFGIGKTTLARKIFNDQKITRYFPAEPNEEKARGTDSAIGKTDSLRVFNDWKTTSNLYQAQPQPQKQTQLQPNDEKMTSKFSKRRFWLHVSKNYSEIELLKEMVRNLGGSDKGEKSRAELEGKLISLIPESFFLVLDDVWSANVWNDLLKGPMSHRAKKCRVLVTTRYETVAKNLKASYTREVNKMDKNSGWELLCKEVFDDEEEEEVQSLREIGYKIVEKCDGFPIVIKAVAGVLRLRDKGEGTMYKTDLVSYWVDEGFVPTNEKTPSLMEETAEQWYRELVWRNLIQRDLDNVDDDACIMPNIFQNLGQALIEGEAICVRGNETVTTNPLMKLRRLLLKSYPGEKLMLPVGITEPRHLRTLFISDSFQINSIGDDLIGKLRNLRILMLNDTNIEGLPHSIGDLFHLRHLDLDRTNIKEIPSSIGGLLNLQTLRAGECLDLHQLPSTITSLRKLRVLFVRGTPLTHVPKGIGRLQNLHTIEGLIIGCDDDLSEQEEKGCDIDELQHLSNLRVLRMHKLHRSSGESATSTIADKSFLQHMVLSERAAKLSEEQILRAQKAYDCLVPSSSIQRLEIHNFPGLTFPRWIMSSSLKDSFPNLSALFLQNVTSCRELPPQLSHLPLLKVLQIKSANAITNIGPQFFSRGSRAVAFPKLERMTFWKMPKWEEWSSLSDDDEVGGVGSTSAKRQLLPNLLMLTLLDCRKLKALPECLSFAPNLKKLWIRARELRKIDNLPILSDTMCIEYCENLETVCDLPSLKRLAVYHCPKLEQVDNLDALQHLYIVTSAEHLPQWLSQLILQPSFVKLVMHCTLELFNNCLRDGPNWHIIRQIPEVNIQSSDEDLYMCYTKDPHYSYEFGKRSTDDSSSTDDGSESDQEDDGAGDGDGADVSDSDNTSNDEDDDDADSELDEHGHFDLTEIE